MAEKEDIKIILRIFVLKERTEMEKTQGYSITLELLENLFSNKKDLLKGINEKYAVFTNLTHFPENLLALHRLETFVYCLVKEGEIDIVMNMQPIKLKKESILICLPGSILHPQKQKGNLCLDIIFLSVKYLHEIALDIRELIPYYIYMMNNPIFYIENEERKLLTDMHQILYKLIASKSTKEYSILATNSIMKAIIYKVSSLISIQTKENRDGQKFSSNRKNILYESFIPLLINNFTTERSVGFYAKKLCITPQYLSTAVKEQSGRSPGDWIDAYVIQESKSLLIYSTLNIQEIAYHLNFETQSLFGKYFKRLENLSPTEFKKKYLKKSNN